MRQIKRGHFECKDKSHWLYERGDMECTSGDDKVTLAITEEHAMDSYNQEFTCEAVLDRETAERLRDWLMEVLS